MDDRRKYVRQRQLEYEAERRAREAAEWARQKLGRAGRDLAGNAAGAAGVVAGVGRGVYNDARAIGDGAEFAYQLANSNSRGHNAAVATGREIIRSGRDYVASRAADPSLLIGDLRRTGTQLNQDLNPEATPPAPTFAGELARRFRVGQNQGEGAYNVASLVLPVAGEVKGAVQLGRFAKAGAAKYIARGASPKLAEYLAQPYEGMGSHLMPRRTRLPGGLPIPKVIMDSPLNVLKPKGIERGMMYKRHFGVDDRYWGGKVPKEFGGGGWSGKRLGWEKYDPVERIWHGTPGVTKAIGLGVPASFGALGDTTGGDKLRR